MVKKEKNLALKGSHSSQLLVKVTLFHRCVSFFVQDHGGNNFGRATCGSYMYLYCVYISFFISLFYQSLLNVIYLKLLCSWLLSFQYQDWLRHLVPMKLQCSTGYRSLQLYFTDLIVSSIWIPNRICLPNWITFSVNSLALGVNHSSICPKLW